MTAIFEKGRSREPMAAQIGAGEKKKARLSTDKAEELLLERGQVPEPFGGGRRLNTFQRNLIEEQAPKKRL